MVSATLLYQICMCSTLNNATFMKNKNLFGMGNCGKTVTESVSRGVQEGETFVYLRDDHQGLVSTQLFILEQLGLYLLLSLRVECRCSFIQ